MLDRWKMVIDRFGKITTGVLLDAAIYITAFEGEKSNITVVGLWQLLGVSVILSLGVLIFPSDSENEPSKHRMLVLRLIYFVWINIVVLGLGHVFGWLSIQNWKQVLLMEVLIILVFIVLGLIFYLNDYNTAKNMNHKLQQKQGNIGKKS